jgi:hypothetical protein
LIDLLSWRTAFPTLLFNKNMMYVMAMTASNRSVFRLMMRLIGDEFWVVFMWPRNERNVVVSVCLNDRGDSTGKARSSLHRIFS